MNNLTPTGVADVKVKYHIDIEPLTQLENGDWIDLRAAETVEMKQGEYRRISLGVSMKLPEGYEAHIVPRSSTLEKFGVIQTNSLGVVDNAYQGQNDIWQFPAFALRDTIIKKNDRICQFRIVENQPYINFDVVDNLENDNRGGFGSTGAN